MNLDVGKIILSVFIWGRKHCGKRTQCWSLAFSHFTTMFSRSLLVMIIDAQNCKGLIRTFQSYQVGNPKMCHLDSAVSGLEVG